MTHARSLVLALTVLLSSVASAQEEAWQLGYVESQTSAVFPERVLPTPDGGAIFFAVVHDLPLPGPFPSFRDSDLRLVVQKFGENGDRAWIRVFPARTRSDVLTFRSLPMDVELDPLGDLYVLVPTMTPSGQGVESQLHRLAPDGSTVWTHDLVDVAGTSRLHWSDVECAPTGGVVVGGVLHDFAYPRLDIRSIDASGQLVWRWSGQGAAGPAQEAVGDLSGIAVSPTGTTYVYGATDSFPFEVFPIVWAIDASGQYLWRSSISCGPGEEGAVERAAFESSGDLTLLSSIIVEPRTLVSGLSPQGFPTYCTPLPGLLAEDIVVDDLGRKFLAGTSNSEMALLRLDAAGGFLGVTGVSAALATSEPSWGRRLALADDGVSMIGFDTAPGGRILVTRFDGNGAERWTAARPGRRDVAFFTSDVGVDTRGNVVATSQDLRGGTGPNRRFSVDLFKLVDGGAVGSSYCDPAVPNSTGVPATLSAIGSDDVQTDNLTLRVDDLPGGAFTLLLASRTQGSMPGVGGGQGTLCLGGAIGRYVGPGQIRRADANGAAALQLDLVVLPQPTGFVSAAAGETWNFQAWYRDANPALTSNLSNGASVLMR